MGCVVWMSLAHGNNIVRLRASELSKTMRSKHDYIHSGDLEAHRWRLNCVASRLMIIECFVLHCTHILRTSRSMFLLSNTRQMLENDAANWFIRNKMKRIRCLLHAAGLCSLLMINTVRAHVSCLLISYCLSFSPSVLRLILLIITLNALYTSHFHCNALASGWLTHNAHSTQEFYVYAHYGHICSTHVQLASIIMTVQKHVKGQNRALPKWLIIALIRCE